MGKVFGLFQLRYFCRFCASFKQKMAAKIDHSQDSRMEVLYFDYEINSADYFSAQALSSALAFPYFARKSIH